MAIPLITDSLRGKVVLFFMAGKEGQNRELYLFHRLDRAVVVYSLFDRDFTA